MPRTLAGLVKVLQSSMSDALAQVLASRLYHGSCLREQMASCDQLAHELLAQWGEVNPTHVALVSRDISNRCRPNQTVIPDLVWFWDEPDAPLALSRWAALRESWRPFIPREAQAWINLSLLGLDGDCPSF